MQIDEKDIFISSLDLIISCENKTLIQQVDSDLKGMLENKVELQNLIINKISTFSENGQELESISFDVELYFISDLFADDFKFNRGMKIKSQNNIFVYNRSLRLVGLKFGKMKRLE